MTTYIRLPFNHRGRTHWVSVDPADAVYRPTVRVPLLNKVGKPYRYVTLRITESPLSVTVIEPKEPNHATL